jgi:hypothetical protein
VIAGRLLLGASLLVVGLSACGVDAAKVPATASYLAHGEKAQSDRPVNLAIVGATRGVLPVGESGVATSVIADVRAEAPLRDLSVVLLTGDQVARSSTAEWQGFADRWSDVLDVAVPSTNKARKPVLAMPGNGERAGDRKLKGFGAAFPDQAIDIGYNREASWSYVDVETQGRTWRLLTLDSRRSALGSRWQEQLFWLPQVVTGDAFDHLVVLMPDPYVTLAGNTEMDRDGGPSELIGIIDDHAGIGKLELIISGGTGTNEFFLPTGVYGEGFLVAGNSGVGAPNLKRWARGADVPFKELTHDALFTLATMAEFDLWARDLAFSDRVRDMAKGEGSWEGFDAEIDGGSFQMQGWWQLQLAGDTLSTTWRMRRHDGSFHDLFTATLGANGAWSSSK